MKTSILISIFIPVIFLFSCSSEKVIFKANRFSLTEEEANKRLDSVLIVEVIDKRKTQDNKIGVTFRGFFKNEVPFIMDQPVSSYLKSSFNSLIVKNNEAKNYIPVTVYINEFKTHYYYNIWDYYPYFKYSFLFEFTGKDSVKKKFHILDSVECTKDNATNSYSKAIKNGVRNSADQFIEYYRNQQTTLPNTFSKGDDAAGLVNKSQMKPTKDSVNLAKIRGDGSKSGGLFKYYAGENIESGFVLAYISMKAKKQEKWEFGAGYGLIHLSIKPHDDIGSGSLYGLTAPIMVRYNLSDDFDGVFLSGNAHLLFGSVGSAGNSSGMFFGGILEESLGIYLGKNVSLTAGVYQFGLTGSNLISSDLGYIINLSITGDYEF